MDLDWLYPEIDEPGLFLAEDFPIVEDDLLEFHPLVPDGLVPFPTEFDTNLFDVQGRFQSSQPMDYSALPEDIIPAYSGSAAFMSDHWYNPDMVGFENTIPFDNLYQSDQIPPLRANHVNPPRPTAVRSTSNNHGTAGPQKAKGASPLQLTLTIEEIFDDSIVADLIGEVEEAEEAEQVEEEEEAHDNEQSVRPSEAVEEYEAIPLNTGDVHTTARGHKGCSTKRKQQHTAPDDSGSEHFASRRRKLETLALRLANNKPKSATTNE